MIILIDGDILVYMAGFASQTLYWKVADIDDDPSPQYFANYEQALEWINKLQTQYPDSGWEMVKEPFPLSKDTAKRYMDNIISCVKANIEKHFKAKTYETEIYLTSQDKSCFRYKVATIKPYKGQRKGAKPIHFKFLRKYLLQKYNTKVCQGVEADDLLGIRQTELEGASIIVTKDKDLKTIPGLHYDLQTHKIFTVSDEESVKYFNLQVLTGDVADNIQGLVGIGPKRAEKALADLDDYQQHMKLEEMYKEAYPETWKSVLDETKCLLFIRKRRYDCPEFKLLTEE